MSALRPLVVAHRGESRDAPENTLAAVRLAWQRGAHAVEIDTRTSSDGVPMVVHDPDTRRLESVRRAVGELTARELSAVDAGRWKGATWTGERVPRLADVLGTVPTSGKLFVELKEGPASVPSVLAVWGASGLAASQVLFMCFQRPTVAALAAAVPAGCEVALLLETSDWRPPAALADALTFAREHRLAALNLQASVALDADIVSRIHGAGLAVHCWTVNSLRVARRLAAAGIDGITTDRCAWMRTGLGQA
jgi:glycerophosphoryl diester phosphodiesterase